MTVIEASDTRGGINVADTRINKYCNLQDVSRQLKAGATQTALTPSSVSSTSVTMADASDAANLIQGDVVKLTSAEYPLGDFREVVDIVTKTLTLKSAVSGTYSTSLSLVQQSPFTPSSTPSSRDVLDMINDAEDEIDEYTGKAWRLITVTEEYHDIPREQYDVYKGRPVNLYHPHVLTDSDDGLTNGTDKIEIFDGSSWVDWTTKTAGRENNNYWVNSTDGILYLYYQIPIHYINACRVTYRYGKVDSSNNPNPPKDIRKACAKIVAAEILEMEPVTVDLPREGGGIGDNDRSEKLRDDAYKLLDRRKEWTLVDTSA